MAIFDSLGPDHGESAFPATDLEEAFAVFDYPEEHVVDPDLQLRWYSS
ncbi:hypothetical protein [Corynebacterium phocae]|nr:hypothetical protein [Corynebacterium phocae]